MSAMAGFLINNPCLFLQAGLRSVKMEIIFFGGLHVPTEACRMSQGLSLLNGSGPGHVTTLQVETTCWPADSIPARIQKIAQIPG